MYIAVTIVAAMLCGVGFVLQQQAAEKLRSAQFLQLSLITALVHKRRWLAGIGALVAGDLLSAWTLGHLDLSVSEPLLTTSLIFALVLAVPLSGQTLRKTDIAGALLLTAGVAALSATRSVRAPTASFGSFGYWPAAAVIAILAAVLVYFGRRGSGQIRAVLTGTAAGLIFGVADAFTRRSVQILDGHHPVYLLTGWPGYATLAASLIGLWLMQNAFSAAPLHTSLPAVTAAEPTAGIVLGVIVFGDVIHITPWLLALQAAAVLAMVSGVILVARAHVFRDLHLRQLPHAALERLQHPVAAHLAAGRKHGHRADDNAGPVTGEHVTGEPGAAATPVPTAPLVSLAEADQPGLRAADGPAGQDAADGHHGSDGGSPAAGQGGLITGDTGTGFPGDPLASGLRPGSGGSYPPPGAI